MSATMSKRVREVFDAAMEQPAEARRSYIERACGDDAQVRDEVLSLLGALDDAGDVLDAGAAACIDDTPGGGLGNDAAALAPVLSLSEVRIGGFRLIRLVGSGGMGSVYEAEQEQPRRVVALKVMRTWASSPAARRRFVEEAQILARVQHPGVAQVFAAGAHTLARGTTADAALADVLGVGHAVPWIAMEFVEGAQTITAFAAQKDLGIKDRLVLMAEVCDAVHHGHIKGVIHRDLKPANVLVNSAGRVKVIDFGVARAADGHAAGMTMLTGEGVLIGTLRYMSPEQCDGDPHGLDTRSDVYSLGVVMYELLAQRLPYELGEGSFTDAVRAIRERTPMPLSEVKGSLKGDLERIVLKALAKERERRYESAADLAADIRRLLANEPIKARAAGVGYRAMKFARRNRAAVVLAGLALAAVVAGAVGVGVGFARAVQAERRAEAGRLEAVRRAYVANIVAADAAINVQDGGAAMARLNDAAPELRGWEWGYLRGRADESLKQIALPVGTDESAVSPDGRVIAVCMNGGGVQCLEVDSGSLRWVVADVRNAGEVPRFSDDGRLLLMPESDGATIVDVATGRPTRRLELPPGVVVLGSAFSPDSKLVALGCSHGHGVWVFEVDTGAFRYGYNSQSWIYAPDFSTDGRLLVTSEAAEVVIREAETGLEVRRFPTARVRVYEPSPVRISPDASLVAVVAGTTVTLHDAVSGARVRTLIGHAQRIHCVAFEPSGRWVVTGSVDKTVRVWDLQSDEPGRVLVGSAAAVESLAFIPDPSGQEPWLLWSGGEEPMARVWSMQPRGRSVTIDFPEQGFYVHEIDFSARNERVVSAAGNRVVEWSLTDRVPRPMTWTKPSLWMMVNADRRATYFRMGDEVVMMPLGSDQVGWRQPLLKSADIPMRIQRDGRLLATQDLQHEITVRRCEDGARVATLRGHTDYMKGFDFGADGRSLISAGEDGTARVWDLREQREVARFVTPEYEVLCVALSPTASLAASGGSDGLVHLWESSTGREVRVLRGFHSAVWSVAFSPDGSRLAVGSQDRVARVFDVERGDELVQLRGHTGTVMRVVWSDDGRYLATGAYDLRVFIWDGGAAASKLGRDREPGPGPVESGF